MGGRWLHRRAAARRWPAGVSCCWWSRRRAEGTQCGRFAQEPPEDDKGSLRALGGARPPPPAAATAAASSALTRSRPLAQRTQHHGAAAGDEG